LLDGSFAGHILVSRKSAVVGSTAAQMIPAIVLANHCPIFVSWRISFVFF